MACTLHIFVVALTLCRSVPMRQRRSLLDFVLFCSLGWQWLALTPACGENQPSEFSSRAASGSEASVPIWYPQSNPNCAIGDGAASATLRASVPAEFDIARTWRFETCKTNVGCQITDVDPDAKLERTADGDFIELPKSADSTTIVGAELRLWRTGAGDAHIEVGWGVGRVFADGDRYTIRAFGEAGAIQIMDESVLNIRPATEARLTSGKRCCVTSRTVQR